MTSEDKPRKRPVKSFPERDQSRSASAPKPAAGKETKSAAGREKRAAGEGSGDGKAERISKVMARAGVASRRDIERMIMEGRVKLNGVLLDSPVVNVTLSDKIEVDGNPIRGIERTRLWLYHKPAGLVTTNADPEGRATVFDNLPAELPRVMSIGRLDINTEGLLLLTNDGGLARVLELPSTGWLRRYRVRAHGDVDQEALDRLKEGMAVDGVLYGSIEATLDRKQGSNVWISMSLREGKNREIKNVLGALGLEVNRLIRISYGPFQLGDLAEGQAMEVRGRTLRDQLGPRLIEDAKANFEAPIYSAAPAQGEADAEEEQAETGARAKPAYAPKFREKPAEKRERALSRLDTKRADPKRNDRDRNDRDRGDRDGDKGQRKPLSTPRRAANVWMAPGARPLGEKAAAKAAKNTKTAHRRGETAAEARQQRQGVQPDRSRTPINRVHEEDGEWIRSSEIEPARERDGRRGRDEGDRPQRFQRGDGEGRPPRDREGRQPRSSDGGFSKEGRERSFGKEGDRPRSFKKPGEGFRASGPARDRSGAEGEAATARPFSKRSDGKPFAGKKPGGKPFGSKSGEAAKGPRNAGSRSTGPGSRPAGSGPKGPRGSAPRGSAPRGPRGGGGRKG